MTLRSSKRVLENRIAAIMASRDRFPFFSLATMMLIGSLVYCTGVRIRESLYAKGSLPVARLDRPVISVGNLTAGGTGKTPMTIHLAQLLQTLGRTVMIVSRGYKGAASNTGTVVSDGHSVLCGATVSGDEPHLMARLLRGVPIVVGKDRYNAACAGLRLFAPDVVLLDDAFQHQRLARDLNLLLMDADAPFGNGYLLPRGPLREPSSALGRADAVLFTRSQSIPCKNDVKTIDSRPVFHTRHVPVLRCLVPAGHPLDSTLLNHLSDRSFTPLRGRSVVAFAGLAHNEYFWHTVEALGATVKRTVDFPDHHAFCEVDIKTVIQTARSAGCTTLVTTDKDFVRLPSIPLPMDLIVVGIEIDFGTDFPRWRALIAEHLNRFTQRRALATGRPGTEWIF
jgi:tetraacyldisaccharide 4'-kinase